MKIQAARKAVTVVGSTHGSSEAARTKPRPRKRWFSMTAHISPSTKVRPVVSTTKTRVFVHTVPMPGSASRRRKLASPTKAGWSMSIVYRYSDRRSDCRNGNRITSTKASSAGTSMRKPVRRSCAFKPLAPAARIDMVFATVGAQDFGSSAILASRRLAMLSMAARAVFCPSSAPWTSSPTMVVRSAELVHCEISSRSAV